MAILEPKLVPLMSDLLNEGGVACYEYLEHSLSMMSYFTYCSDKISHQMWELCGPLLLAFQTWAYDFIRDISIPLMNYMTKVY